MIVYIVLVLLLIMPVIIPIGIYVLINKQYHIEYSNASSVPKGKFRIGKDQENEE